MPIHLYYYEGYSIKEIAEIMEVPVGTIGTRLSRGRKLLEKMIGGIDKNAYESIGFATTLEEIEQYIINMIK